MDNYLDIGALFKDHKYDYKMPKIDGIVTSVQFRPFNKTAKSWWYADLYLLLLISITMTQKKI